MSSTRRSSARFVLGLLLLLALLPAGYFFFLDRPPAVPAAVAALPAPSPKPGIVVAELSGPVEVRTSGSEWHLAQQGERLSEADALRTKEGATALLSSERGWQVRLESDTSVSVDQLRSSISKLMLESGMAVAQVDGGTQQSLEFVAANSDVRATASEANFTMSSDGKGLVALGTQAGEVELSAQGKTVKVSAGTQSLVKPGSAPTDPVAIPSSLLLKVALPGQTVRARTWAVKGEAEVGSRVSVMGKTVYPDARGHFAVQVNLKEGKNLLSVQAQGVGGTRSEKSAPVTVDTTAPSMQVDVRWK